MRSVPRCATCRRDRGTCHSGRCNGSTPRVFPSRILAATIAAPETASRYTRARAARSPGCPRPSHGCARMPPCDVRPAIARPRQELEPHQPPRSGGVDADYNLGRQGHRRGPQHARQPRQGCRLGHRRRAARQVPAQGKVLRGSRRRLRLLRRGVRLGHDGRHLRQHDAHRLAQGLSGRARQDRSRHLPERALGWRRAVLPRRVRRCRGTARKSHSPSARGRY